MDPPFQLSPETGQLKPGEECRVTVEFKPQQALVYQAEACCAFGDDGKSSCTVLLRGLCEYTELFKEFQKAQISSIVWSFLAF